MQLSLVEQFPELNKSLFLDVFAKMSIDARTHTPTLSTLGGQRVRGDVKIRCLRKVIEQFPEGTIYKLDVRLVKVTRGRPYFCAIQNNRILRAVEFFEHNIRIQRTGLLRPGSVKNVLKTSETGSHHLPSSSL